jgi:hypothetical protein
LATSTARTLSISIEKDARLVYDFVRDAEQLPRWVAFCKAIRRSADGWVMETDQGTMTLRFADDNAFGVLDHWVTTPGGAVVHVPMRVVPNGSGSELVFTVFRAPGMSDEQLAADVALVERDLASLKRLLEAR